MLTRYPRRLCFPALFLCLTSLGIRAQTLLKDVLPGPTGSSPAGYVAVGSTLYFIADDGVHGRELWKSDGTAAGTLLVKDINPGPKSADIQGMIACNGLLFFSANASNNQQLWRSDGTDAGTFEPEDGHKDGEVGTPVNLTKVGNAVFYVTKGTLGGTDQWLVSHSDGTNAPFGKVGGTGAFFVFSFTPVPGGYHPPTNFTNVNGTLFFTYDGALYKTVGQPTDPTLSVIKVLAVPNIDRLVNFGNRLYFVAGTHRSDVWTSDGTAEATVQWVTTGTDPIVYLTGAGSYLYFVTGLKQRTLWVSGGLNKSIPGLGSSQPVLKKLITFPATVRLPVSVRGITSLSLNLSTTVGTPPIDVTCFIAGDAVYTIHSVNWKLTRLPGIYSHIDAFVRAGPSLFFTDAGGLYQLTSQETPVTLFKIIPGPTGLTALTDRLYFSHAEPDSGSEPCFIEVPETK